MKDRRSYLGVFYAIFLMLFVVLPLLVVAYYAFIDANGNFTLENFINFFSNTKAWGTLVYSLIVACTTTAVALLIAYPTAYILARSGIKRSGIILILLVMPMWINFTLRITALKEILSAIEGNLAYYAFFNTILCQVYDFLPFMIMPIYTCISGIDWSYIEAARDLGADKKTAFFKVVLPLSKAGIASGITMVFLPAMTNYVVLDMIYNSTYIMGSLIGSYFSAFDWNNGSMISLILLLFILLGSRGSNKLSKADEELRKEAA